MALLSRAVFALGALGLFCACSSSAKEAAHGRGSEDATDAGGTGSGGGGPGSLAEASTGTGGGGSVGTGGSIIGVSPDAAIDPQVDGGSCAADSKTADPR